MAAHFVTYLKEAIELDQQGKFDNKQLDLFIQALEYAQLGNTPKFIDWQTLHCKFPSDFIVVAKLLMPKYEKIWEELGQPKTHEEWQAARFSGHRKGEID